MNKKCSKCDKVCYPTEQINCLDKIWHKNCFKCTHCNLTLNMKNYKGFDKQPYCAAHYPQQKPTSVDTNPELNRIKENNKFQSNIKYHQDFERSKGIFTSVADDPETRRVLENSKNISQAKYHEDFEKNIKNKCTQVCDAPGITRAIENQKLVSSAEYKSVKHQQQNGVVTSTNLPLGVMNGNHNVSSQHHVVQTANIVSHSVQVAKYVDGERQIVTSQKMIGSIADYDPINHENVDRKTSVTVSKTSMTSTAAPPPPRYHQQHQPPPQIINNPMDYQTRMTAYLNSDIKTSVYKAIYDYDASEEDELSFRDGDKFINCEQIDVGWMIGVHEKSGKHGMFPSNYAEPVDYF